MITLHLLGTLELRGVGGRHLASPLSGAKRLALLAYLTLAGRQGLLRRDTLLAMFWPELDQKHARNSLSNMLHQIRRSLGPDALVVRGNDEVGLAEGVLWCDVVAFEAALEERRSSDALELYRGDLLEGFFISAASAGFDQWLDAERARLRRLATEASRTLIHAAERSRNPEEAVRWSRRALALDPYDEPTARRLIVLLDRGGDRAGALRAYQELAVRLAREFEAEPAVETREVIAEVRAREEVRAAAVRVETPEDGRGRHAAGDTGGSEIIGGGGDDLPFRSIAVLPFENLSGTAEGAPFAAGLHDDLLTELSGISALDVIARTSVLRYRDTRKSVPEIGRELGVGTIVEGGVQTAGGRLRLNVQVIDAMTGAHRWAERYERDLSMDDILEIQSDLAREIARTVRAKLTPAERERAGKEPTGNLEAYRLYAQGRGYLDQRTASGMRRSLEYFDRAVELDPGYALAWAGLGDALSLLHDYGYEAADRVLPRAERAVRQALALDPELAEAHTSLGEYHVARRDGPAAMQALRRAVELRSGYAEAHNWLGWMSMVLGDAKGALAYARRAVELDPLSPEAVSNRSLALLTNGDAAGALGEARRTRELQPDWSTGAFYEGLALYHLGRYAESIGVLRNLTVQWAGSGPRLTLALAYVADGAEAPARELLSSFQEVGDGFSAGLVLLALGQEQPALNALRSVTRWDYWPTLAMHHFYPALLRPIRADPLHRRLRREMDREWGSKPGTGIGGPAL